MKYTKPERYVNEKYKQFIRNHECMSCYAPAPSIPHHIKTRGSGGDDTLCVPMDLKCHQAEHMALGLPKLELYKACVRYLTEYLREIEP